MYEDEDIDEEDMVNKNLDIYLIFETNLYRGRSFVGIVKHYSY